MADKEKAEYSEVEITTERQTARSNKVKLMSDEFKTRRQKRQRHSKEKTDLYIYIHT